jgi:hypothetical protein
MISPVASDQRAEAEGAGADCGSRGHGVPGAVSQRLGLAPPIVRIDHTLRFPPDRVDEARAVVEKTGGIFSNDPRAVLAAAFG